jgi:hypothetical protein
MEKAILYGWLSLVYWKWLEGYYMLNWKKQSHPGLKLAILFLLSLLLLAAVACGPADITPTPATNNTPLPSDSQDGYPPPPATVQMPVEAYPATEEPTGVLIALDKPIASGAESVSGVGPPGLTVYIMNITFMGEQMGTAVVDENGRFTVPVAPIQPGIRLGVTADVTSVGLTEDDILPGDGEIGIPQVGYFYDSFVISQN